MENNDRDDLRPEGAKITVRSPFWSWLDNFFYHYKWHTVTVAFLLIVAIICSFQMCNKVTYDSYILYAGGDELSKIAKEGETPDYIKLNTAINQYTDDNDKNGERSVYLLNLYLPSIAQIEAMKKDGYEVPYGLMAEDKKTFEYQIDFGSEFYVMLLSEELFLAECNRADGLSPFNPIASYTNGNPEDYTYINDYGIYLSSTTLYEKAGFSLLPEDTVICIKAPTFTAGGKKSSNYDSGAAMLKKLLEKG